MHPALENLCGPGKQLKAEAPDEKEMAGLLRTGVARLHDAQNTALGACRTWGVESENRPQRDQFLPDLQPNSRAIGQKDGKKWAAAVDLQPTIRKSDRLLVACCTPCKSAQKTP